MIETYNTIYKAAIYCRLSQDDGNLGDSSSIQTQKMMLEKYCKDNNFKICDYYIDDGFSGGNFNRPSFQKMIKDIEDKKINLVITKDLSRLGRDYIMTGYYTEIYFPDNKVRYIAINDNIDTLRNDNDIAPFKNILNDMYLKDISRKVKTARKQRAIQGLFQGGGAPYGYIKDPNNKNKLLINPETSKVVRYIFDLMLSGHGTIYIARKLASEKILSPAAHKVSNGDTRFSRYVNEENKYKWAEGTVYKILVNPSYTGDMVNMRQEIINYKTKKNVLNPKDKWIIVPNTHEAIITREEFERTQELISIRKTPRKKYELENLFKGLVKCARCGKPFVLTAQNRYNKITPIYRCNEFTNLRKDEKHWITIKYSDLKDIVTSRVREFFAILKDDGKFMELIQAKIKENNVSANYEKELSKIEARQKVLINITKKVYDDYFEGLLNVETYQELIKKYQTEQNGLKEKYNLLLRDKSKMDHYLDDIHKLKELVTSFLDFKELTQEMVYNLIDKIEIDNVGDFKQHKQREIKITYRFLEIQL